MNGLFKQVSLWVVLAIIVILVLSRFSELDSRPVLAGQSDFAAQIAAGNIENPESKPILKGAADYLKSCPDRAFYLVGHTEAKGTLDYRLSADQAQAVVDALVRDHGIAAVRLEAHGVGPLVPRDSNATGEGRARNRRVELVER